MTTRHIPLIGLGFAALTAATPAWAENVPLDLMLIEMKRALVLVSKDPSAAALPPLKSATLNASTVQTKDGGGSLKLLIVEIGGKKSSELTTSVSITLAPKDNKDAPVGTMDVAQSLAEAILSAGKAVAAANKAPPALQVSEIEATIKFGVTSNGRGGLKFSFGPAEIGVEGAVTRESVQEIVVTYGG